MGFDIINTLKRKKGITNAQLAEQAGVTLSTIDKITAGINTNPKLDTLQAICRVLGCSLNDFDDTPRNTKKEAPSELSEEALKVALDYTELDQPGKNVVRVVIVEEGKRVQAEKERRQVAVVEPAETRYIPLYYTPAAAGMSSPAMGQDFDYIEVGNNVPRQADFAVKIDGDSMEPYIRDGSTVYVNREPLVNGDVGIFYVDGDMLCKQYYKDDYGNVHLLSLNRTRSDADRYIHAKDNDTVMTYYGRVILPRRPLISLL